MMFQSKLIQLSLFLSLAGGALAQGDDCSTASAIGATGSFAFDTTVNTTSGFNGGGSCSSSASSIKQDAFWQWTAPASGTFQFDTNTSTFNTRMSVHSGVGCAATCDDYDANGGIGIQSLIQLSGISMGDTFLIQVGGSTGNFGPGFLNINQILAPCAGPDIFESNDTCATPAMLPMGFHSFLNTHALSDADFYSVVIPAGDTLDIRIYQTQGSVDVNVYDNTCSPVTTIQFNSYTYVNTTGAVETIIIEPFSDVSGSASDCSEYTLSLWLTPAPSCQGVDDGFEDNDDCATASVVGNGTLIDLTVSKADHDHYAFCVDAGGTVSVDTLFSHSVGGDINIFLWDATDTNCGIGFGPMGFGSTHVAFGFSGDDDEHLSWTNVSAIPVDLILEVKVNDGSAIDCNTYDLVISGACGPVGAGTTFCDPGSVNSTGVPTALFGTFGSGVGSDLHLEVTSGVPGEIGYFLAGNEITIGMPISNGLLCLIGTGTANLYRYNIAGGDSNSIGRFDAGGVLQNIVGTSAVGSGFDVPNTIPAGIPFTIMAGDTWNFQCWHRDTPVMSGSSNFSNGYSVVF